MNINGDIGKLSKGERVRVLRKKLGLSMEKFGERIGMAKTSISSIENGYSNLTQQVLLSISNVYNVSVAWLESGTGEMFKTETEDAKYYKKLIDEKFSSSDDSFRQALLEVILQLDDESIDTVKKYALRFLLPAIRKEIATESPELSAADRQHDDGQKAAISADQQQNGANPLSVADELEIQRKAADYAEQLRAEKIAEAGSEASNITEGKKEA